MKRKDSAWDDPKVRELYLQCLQEIPLAKNVPRGRPKTPPVSFKPTNFDELYAAREDLQAGKIALYREPRLQEWYASLNSLAASYQKMHPESFHPFKTELAEKLRADRISIGPNEYPYPVPDDTAHNVFWFARGVNRFERARYLSRLLFMEELDKGDFFLFRNSPYGKSVPEFDHDHLYTRIKPGGWGILKPFVLHVEVAMAMADEPGYTLDRAFRNVVKHRA